MRQVYLFILIAGLCHGVSKATVCTERGRFPNDDTEDCRGYTMCLLGGASGFTQYKLTCPIGFVYSHLEQQCTNATNYFCLSSYVCKISGSFVNPLSKNCSSYIACPEGINGIVTARRVECPVDQVFNPLKTVCDNNTDYKCNAGLEPTGTTDSFSEPVTTVSYNATDFNVQVSGENEFQLSSNVSVNSAIDVCSKYALLFATLIIVNINN